VTGSAASRTHLTWSYGRRDDLVACSGSTASGRRSILVILRVVQGISVGGETPGDSSDFEHTNAAAPRLFTAPSARTSAVCCWPTAHSSSDAPPEHQYLTWAGGCLSCQRSLVGVGVYIRADFRRVLNSPLSKHGRVSANPALNHREHPGRFVGVVL